MEDNEKKSIEAFLSPKGEKIKGSWRLKEVKKLKKQASKPPSSRNLTAKEDYPTEDKVFVIGKFRLFVFKPGAKNEHIFHILDLQNIHCSATEATLNFSKGVSLTFLYSSAQEVQSFLNGIRTCFVKNFPTTPQEKGLQITFDTPQQLGPVSTTIGSCGGFVRTYRCVSAFMNVNPCEDICWDVDNLFELSDRHDLDLREFILPKTSQVKAIIEALRFNTWFTQFTIVQPNEGRKLKDSVLSKLSDILRDNDCIRNLQVSGVGSSGTFQSIAKNLVQNMSLSSINFSQSNVEDKGLSALSTDCFSIMHSLSQIDLSHCNLGNSGLSSFFKALQNNSQMCQSLEILDVSHNKFSSNSCEDLCSFLFKASSLSKLCLKNCNLPFGTLIAKFPSVQTLSNLDLSGNKISLSKKEGTFNIGSVLLSKLPTLQELSLSSIGLSNELTTLSSHSSLTSLDVSDNDLGDDGITELVDKLLTGIFTGLKILNVSGNFGGSRSGTVRSKKSMKATAVDKLMDLISSNQKCPIEVLKMNGDLKEKGQLKSELLPFVFSLLGNESLIELEICHHGGGDQLAVALAKVAQVNFTLKSLHFDGNQISAEGFRKFFFGLSKNSSLVRIPFPHQDIGAIKTDKISNINDWNQLLIDFQNKILQNAKKALESNPTPQRAAPTIVSTTVSPGIRKRTLNSKNPITPTFSVQNLNQKQVTIGQEESNEEPVLGSTRVNIPSSSQQIEIPNTASSSNSVRVIEGYEADVDGAISVPKGVMVEIVEQSNGEWYTVTYNGATGFVPTSCLQLATPPPLPSFDETEEKTNKTAVVLYDFEPDSNNDERVLALKQGVTFIILEENYENSTEWSLARYEGVVGLVPNSLIQITGNESNRRSTAVPKTPPPKVDVHRLTTKFGPEVASKLQKELISKTMEQRKPKNLPSPTRTNRASVAPLPPPVNPTNSSGSRASVNPISPPPTPISPPSIPPQNRVSVVPVPFRVPPNQRMSVAPLKPHTPYNPSMNRRSVNINPNNNLTRKTKKIDYRRASTIYATLAQNLEDDEEDDVVIDADFAQRFQSWMDKK